MDYTFKGGGGGGGWGGGTCVTITYVSKENNLGPDDEIRYIWGVEGPILYFVKRSHLLGHFGTLTMTSVF